MPLIFNEDFKNQIEVLDNQKTKATRTENSLCFHIVSCHLVSNHKTIFNESKALIKSSFYSTTEINETIVWLSCAKLHK